MKTIQPTNAMILREDTRFEPGTYVVPEGITIAADGITVDGNGARLIGNGVGGTAIQLEGVSQVTLKNFQISGFSRGIAAVDGQSLTIKNCRIRDGALNPNALPPAFPWQIAEAFPVAIFLAGVTDSQIINNDLQCQANGLAAYSCQRLEVRGNTASHQPGFGFLLNDTSQSTFRENTADHCGADGLSPHAQTPEGHLAAGFLLVNGAEHNVFQSNTARACSTGFKLMGLTPQNQAAPCSQNRFEGNDASHCIYDGFADHHNQENHYLQNQVHNANIGFTLDHVSGARLENNSLFGNHRAGVAAVNSVHCDLIHNTLQDNRFGVLLWSRPDPQAQSTLPENDTSKFWEIRNNTFLRNHTGIRIAADQVAGLTALGPDQAGKLPKPHDHEILQNVFSDNRIGIQTQGVERTVIKDNQFELNLLGDIKS